MIKLVDAGGVATSARDLILKSTDSSPVVNLLGVNDFNEDFIETLYTAFLSKRFDRVSFVGASEKFQKAFMRSYWFNAGKFTVEFF